MLVMAPACAAAAQSQHDPEPIQQMFEYFFPTDKIEAFLRDSHCADHLFASIAHLLVIVVRSSAYILAPIFAIKTFCTMLPGCRWNPKTDAEKAANTAAFMCSLAAGFGTFFLLLGGVSFFWAPFFSYAAAAQYAGECSNPQGFFWMAVAPLWAVATSWFFWGGFIIFCLVSKIQGK